MKTACAPTTPRSRSRASSPIINRRFRETDSEWAREELGKVFLRRALRSLPRLSAQAGGAVRQDRRQAYRRDLRTVGAPRRRMVRDRAEGAQRAAERDRRARAEGDPRAAVVPARCRPQLPDPGARLRHAVRRRKPAHPAGLADRLGADRRALCAGRALDRPAPARQCAAIGNPEAAARPRQYRDRGRA